ncbi:MAG: ParB N-terminal domain-containing protein [Rubripirellula sp.]
MRNPKIGWQGKPIEVIEHNGYRYVVNGHHRLEAARRAGIEVP